MCKVLKSLIMRVYFTLQDMGHLLYEKQLRVVGKEDEKYVTRVESDTLKILDNQKHGELF